MTALAPIPTRYAGCHFRSRLEARWAVFFDALQIAWRYEPEGFIGWYGEAYLPDFYLPEIHVDIGETIHYGTYVEVKGTDDALRSDGHRIGSCIDYHASPLSEAGLLLLGDVPRGEGWVTLHSFLDWHKGVQVSLARFGDHTMWDGDDWRNVGSLTGAPRPLTDLQFWNENTSENVPNLASVESMEVDPPTYRRGAGGVRRYWDAPEAAGRIAYAYQRARSARFEHGESGPT